MVGKEVVIAVDPGGTSGVVIAKVDWEDGFEILVAREVKWMERIEEFTQLFHTHHPDTLIVEEFRLYQHEAKHQVNSDFPSSQVIGNLQVIAVWDGFALGEIVYLPAAVKMRVEILPEHKEVIGNSEHMKDAYKLLRYWYVTRKARGCGNEEGP